MVSTKLFCLWCQKSLMLWPFSCFWIDHSPLSEKHLGEALCRRFLWARAASNLQGFRIQRLSAISCLRDSLLQIWLTWWFFERSIPTASLMQARPRRSPVTSPAHLRFHTCIVRKGQFCTLGESVTFGKSILWHFRRYDTTEPSCNSLYFLSSLSTLF